MSDDHGNQGGKPDAEDGMSKEEWLRQNPGQASDPVGEEVDEGVTKEEYLRKVQGQDGQSGHK